MPTRGTARPRVGDALDERHRVLERRARRQRDPAGPLERGAIRQRVAVGQPELEQVGARVDEPEGDRLRARGIRETGHGVRDERRSSVG